MNEVYFTSDTHFGHKQTVERFGRPFATHEEMTEHVITGINKVVKRGDRIYHLGDVAWNHFDTQKQFLDRLNTKMVYLIRGNHDKDKALKGTSFVTIKDMDRVKVDGHYIVLCHYPLLSWNRRTYGAYHCFGHVHGRLKGHGRSMDVGVDTRKDLMPYHYTEVVSTLQSVQPGDEGGYRNNDKEQ